MTAKKTAEKTVAARVTVFPRRQILDPQGKAILQALHRLGFDQVRDVRAGKTFDLVLRDDGKAAAALEEMAAKLLANPVVEDYVVQIGTGEIDGAVAGRAEEDGA